METASPRTHKPKIVNESLHNYTLFLVALLIFIHRKFLWFDYLNIVCQALLVGTFMAKRLNYFT